MKPIIGYCDYTKAREWAASVCSEPHDVWYTERNGDAITLVVAAGTKPEDLPKTAKWYVVLEWIQPEWEFGDPRTVRPKHEGGGE